MQYFLILTLILAPTYAIRFKFLSFPANLLMIWVFLFWLSFAVWLLAKKKLSTFLTAVKNADRKILRLTGLFFLSGVISLFTGGIDRAKLGQFIVIFLQPILTFFIAGFIIKQNQNTKYYIINTIYFLLALAGIYALIQYFTLWGLPAAWWGNSIEPKRALSFFAHPNFYALWCAPLLAFLIPDIFPKIKNEDSKIRDRIYPVAWLLGAAGLLFSLSRAGWLGLAAAIGIYTLVVADKKIRRMILGGIIVIAIVIIAVPNLRWRFILPFYGEKSATSRVELWGDGFTAIKESPIFGLGLNGFAYKYEALNSDPTLDTHNFPHNIFLNFWVETGLLGLISFIYLTWLYIYRGLKNRGNLFALGVSLFLIAMVFQGLVDNPYFKNDLALVFWTILAMF
ncbi:MAG: O-antigen ligase family protein [Candidatus Doudnabacteria bacterium]|nr:O-antigen ligase family protein [Candidatus Doudnabacteria bacterium]